MADSDNTQSSVMLHEVPPREVNGRDTVARYQAQFRAAAFECLSLLEDDEIDRVYCDYQDDYVSRLNVNGRVIYNFYQVKTKGKRNHQWSLNEIFGLYKKRKQADSNKIAVSFAGKLLLHTIRFKNCCGGVFFLTNVHFDDDVEACSEALAKSDKDNAHYALLVENFNSAFSQDDPLPEEEIVALLNKLVLEPNIAYLSPDDQSFSALARQTIFKYSEIDLRHSETEEIINSLIALVERKSFAKLVSDIDEDDLDEAAGVGVTEMLDVLCISKGAYRLLKAGGDPKAIKNASIIQRLLTHSGASDRMIEYASECKVNWDVWLRNKRHTIPEFELNFLLESVDQLADTWVKGQKLLGDLKADIDALLVSIVKQDISAALTQELLLGAVFSSLVRSESQ